MYDPAKYKFYKEWLDNLRYTIFYNPSIGMFCSGKVIRNLTPAAFVIQNKDDAVDESFLQRVLIHTSTNKDDIRKTVSFIRSLGFLPVVHSSYDIGISECTYREGKVYSNPKTVFIISTCDGAKEHSPESDIYDIILKSQRDFVDGLEIQASTDRVFRVEKYDVSSKPLRHEIYDSVLYAERWSLLTIREKILRCCFTVVFAPTIVIPIVLLLSYVGNKSVQEEASSMNLLSWQYREYNQGIRTVSEDLLNDDIPSTKRERILSHIKQEAEKQSFMVNDGKGNLQLTELGKKVSTKHNLFLMAGNNELTKRQLLLRCTTFLILGSVYLLKLVALSCHFFKFDRIALYCSVVSYFIMFLGGLYLLSYKNKISRVCAAFIIGFAGIFMATNVLMLCYDAKFGHEFVLSSVIAGITGTMIAITLICHFLRRKDRKIVSKLDGLSTTAYLSIKDHLKMFDDIEYIKIDKYEFMFVESVNMPIYNACKAGVFGQQELDNLQEEKSTEDTDTVPRVDDDTLLLDPAVQDSRVNVGATGCKITEVLDSDIEEAVVTGTASNTSRETSR
ncbi:putative integral membrane protein [Ehrlichia ruminantium]|uniref:hypothetical protein n=1 Tax=Ehrlichia ruminantium TaxID=779 RepID=UPI0007C144B8|nr:hypothetical protein [Ehrlichia ruminantium]QLK52773.1 hypothetical protein FDZ65_04715 [Ehrlichia ruminantium]QLK54607.1 hypothetical protein FDZ63_04725 [Ehrlichia ruminantium]QLK57356.1 hypothetical protein FDZ60_04725 [Ehrlichia ruminantium]GAT76713.1 putative integral membrane protein [Ehrlichia ruminantium]